MLKFLNQEGTMTIEKMTNDGNDRTICLKSTDANVFLKLMQNVLQRNMKEITITTLDAIIIDESLTYTFRFCQRG